MNLVGFRLGRGASGSGSRFGGTGAWRPCTGQGRLQRGGQVRELGQLLFQGQGARLLTGGLSLGFGGRGVGGVQVLVPATLRVGVFAVGGFAFASNRLGFLTRPIDFGMGTILGAAHMLLQRFALLRSELALFGERRLCRRQCAFQLGATPGQCLALGRHFRQLGGLLVDQALQISGVVMFEQRDGMLRHSSTDE